jgi:hypothetical protein
VNGDGELVHRGVGFLQVNDFLELGAAAINPDMQLLTLEKKYKNGERNGDFIVKYATALQRANLDVSEVADVYLNSLTNYDAPQTMVFVMETTTSQNQKGFEVVTSNLEKYCQFFGKEEVLNRLDYCIQMGNGGDLEKILAAYKTYFPKEADRMSAKFLVAYYMYAETDDAAAQFTKAAVNYLDKYGTENSTELNSIAWRFYETTDDVELLKKAVVWAEKSVQLEENFYNTDTLAALSFKLGQKSKAKKWAKKAIAYAQAEGLDSSETQELLKQIEAL